VAVHKHVLKRKTILPADITGKVSSNDRYLVNTSLLNAHCLIFVRLSVKCLARVKNILFYNSDCRKSTLGPAHNGILST
jgi:hypothetical protein